MPYLNIKRELYSAAAAITENGRPAHVQEQLAGAPYVIVGGAGLHFAFEHHEAAKLARGEAAKCAPDMSAAVYYQRTGRQLGKTDGTAVLSPEQIAVIDALLRWG